jgi:hypothetical protein
VTKCVKEERLRLFWTTQKCEEVENEKEGEKKRTNRKRVIGIRLEEKMNFFNVEKSKEYVSPYGNNHIFLELYTLTPKNRFVL